MEFPLWNYVEIFILIGYWMHSFIVHNAGKIKGQYDCGYLVVTMLASKM